jgi:hypothetical protein
VTEFVLNSASLAGDFVDIEAAAAVVASIGAGMSTVIAGTAVRKALRLPVATTLLRLGDEFTLSEVLIYLLKQRSVGGTLFASLATKYPVEDDLAEDEFGLLVGWQLPDHPGCLSLALCAGSGRIAVSVSQSAEWQVDPLVVRVIKDAAQPEAISIAEIENLYSEGNAAAIVDRHRSRRRASASPGELWRDRTELYPMLDLAPGVERNLRFLREDLLEAAVSRLDELNAAVAGWQEKGAAEPPYLSKVTGESGPTMDQFGDQRVFKSAFGGTATFEKHARLHDAYRVHLREHHGIRRIEIGYIGPHLDIVSEN